MGVLVFGGVGAPFFFFGGWGLGGGGVFAFERKLCVLIKLS